MPAWWNSLEQVRSVNGWILGFLALFGAVAGLLTLAAWMTGNRVGTLKAELQAPRRVSAEDRTTILSALGEGVPGTLDIAAVNGNDEALTFARDLRVLLQDAGWTVTGLSRTVFPEQYVGVVLRVNDVAAPPPFAVGLLGALDSAGFSPSLAGSVKNEPDTLTLIVGPKPQD